jgi:hypothetical protein
VKIRTDVAELLRAGCSNREIARRTGVDHTTAARARAALRIPPLPGGTRALTPATAFTIHTRPVRGGHLEWTGHRNSHGTPLIRIAGRTRSAYRIAFQMQYRREPVGHVRTGCDHEGCVAPAHVEDRLLREQYTVIFGAAS